MSEGSAGRRVAAARVCRRFPEAFERIARGDLHLRAVCALAPYLTHENATELFGACKGKTRRQIEELLAARFPRPDVREQIRRLPVRVPVPGGAGEPVEAAEPIGPPTQAPDGLALTASAIASATEIPVIPMSVGQSPGRPAVSGARRARELEPLSADRFGVHFTADAELRELIERARALASHRLPNGDLAGLMKLMAACFVREEEKRRFGVGAKPRRTKAEAKPARDAARAAPPGGVFVSPTATEPTQSEGRATPAGKRGRYLSAAVRRETHGRDRGQCAFVSAYGRRCDARAFLELDHVKPFARLGASDAANLRLLCKAHNLLHARNCFGAMHLAAKIAAKRRPGRATPSSAGRARTRGG